MDIQDSVLYRLGQTGEMASRISDKEQKKIPQVFWGEMIGLRNRIFHEYYEIDLTVKRVFCIFASKCQKNPAIAKFFGSRHFSSNPKSALWNEKWRGLVCIVGIHFYALTNASTSLHTTIIAGIFSPCAQSFLRLRGGCARCAT